MTGLYKIETPCEISAESVAKHIRQFGGKVIRRGFALLTDHQFTATQVAMVWQFISYPTSDVSEDDISAWNGELVCQS
ncbi:hypothetical protein L3Q72_06615 [Vibrio sp. JC009]|uniref:hypothetical protein n=1 Tax=Vibrio sp. JC009 TaxID=2912314 RepID=UPI0023AF98F0|nr:hypothetical protein [Vibrio sp. JC009]WED23060.1 hypothetical protein L3Q72_06615 [Vibrio sp. JC009]